MTTDTVSFQVKHESFEGPIEVLLELIEKRKLFVNDISLATVTDDFISYIQKQGMHPEYVAPFLSVAATLLLIKARSLLPTLELTEEENESISDLERRLALYQIITEVSKTLIQKYGKKILFEGARRMSGTVFAPDETLSLQDLCVLADEATVKVPPPPKKDPEVKVYKTISIAEVLDTLHERIQKALSVSFNDIVVHAPEGGEKEKKVYVIVSFLGMLELVRRGFVDASQEGLFQNIELKKQSLEEHASPSHQEEQPYV